jgi:flagellar biosynthesis protein FlhG
MRDHVFDQALGMRRLFEKRGVAMVSVAGAGTTPVTLEIAAALADAGRRVLIVDRTHGEAAAGLGVKARYEFAHVVAGEKLLADVARHATARICVLPAARALAAIDGGDAAAQQALADLLDCGAATFDFCLVNGVAPALRHADPPARDVVLVTTPAHASITEAYAQIKWLAQRCPHHRFRIVVNRATSEATAMSVYANLAETARRFLAARLDYGGFLPGDDAAPARLRDMQRESARPASARSHAVSRLAELLVSDTPARHASV